VIFPGVEISLEALSSRAAALPTIDLTPPRALIGKSTIDAIRAGVLYGYAGMVDGIIGRLHQELGEFKTLATGGLAGRRRPTLRHDRHRRRAAHADRPEDHLGAQLLASPEALRAALAADPSLATARPDGARTLLHSLVDWPGHREGGPELLAVLVEFGADVNAPFGGPQHDETPLHWAASADDVVMVDALLDAGAEIEARGGTIAGGTALDDAVGYEQWRAAACLLERGAVPAAWIEQRAAGFDSVAAWVHSRSG
jgi:hypothetical protein